ncbi:hypothetical protein [Bosea sp. (in: a-proteobacteria)]|uniref:hypothetical protein n=1 Tax=Bosea sp. (in: a-proteobacteria) TaxID=1871050 RepID=UPI002FC5C575
MNRLLPPALAFLALSGSVALAQPAPSAQERMACRSDATRLCASFIGKPEQMNACLRDNKAKLSESCRKVVEARGG